MSRARAHHIVARNTRPEDFPAIRQICRLVYPWHTAWSEKALSSHLEVFPEGQIVAVERRTGEVVGMCASLIVRWDDYEFDGTYHDFTDHGMFTNHDPAGRTLYGAEVMVHPGKRGRGVGKRLYAARRQLVLRLGLRRIRAGARLRGYHRHADRMSPEEYARAVVRGEIGDPTISFQLSQGFRILAVVRDYDQSGDPESLGHAALIEWLNPMVAKPEDWAGRDLRYQPPRRKRERRRRGGGAE